MINKYGYSSPTDGTYIIDGKTFSVGKDFRTIERYKEYLDVGLDTLLLQGNDPYLGEEYETSQLKKNMDNAYAAGIKRIIVFDKRINELSKVKGGIVGEDKQFKNDEDLEKYCRICIENYKNHPGFIGVMLVDEPPTTMFDSIGSLERALEKVCPGIYCHCNLLPYYGTILCDVFQEGPRYDVYKTYIEEFCKKVPQKILTMDSYPFRVKDEKEPVIIDTHFPGLQIIADVARQYDRDIALVLQSYAGINKGKYKVRKINYKTMLYQYNSALMFGVKEMAFFTYWRKQMNMTDGEFFVENGSFITSEGNKTELYENVKKILEENKYLEDELENAHYVECTYLNSPLLNEAKLKLFENIRFGSTGEFLITHLIKDSINYYCIQNISDPDLCENPCKISIISLKNLEIFGDLNKKRGINFELEIMPGCLKILKEE